MKPNTATPQGEEAPHEFHYLHIAGGGERNPMNPATSTPQGKVGNRMKPTAFTPQRGTLHELH